MPASTDWQCTSCGWWNWRGRSICRNPNCPGPGDHVAVIASGRTGFVVREADPTHPMEDPERVLVRWHDDGTSGWPYRKYLRIAQPRDLDAFDEKSDTGIDTNAQGQENPSDG